MTEQTIQPKGFEVNLSPDAFHRWATHYYKCKQDFEPPHKFSPVPYFLVCRAIELEIKSRHLKNSKQQDVKDKYGHDFMRSYKALPHADKVLSDDELTVLERANIIYKSKGFEYFKPVDALTGYSAYPDLEELDAVAIKLIRDAA